MSLPYLTKLIQKLAPKAGARVVVEPEWGVVAQIIYKNGIVRSLRGFATDLNSIAAADIAKDKQYAKFFMKKWSYPIAPGQTIFREDFAKILKTKQTFSFAKKYAKKLRYPVIVKPNDRSQGSDVTLVHGEEELKSTLKKIFKNSRIALVEKYLPGRDYRIVVLDGKIISAYERIPLSVIGDGNSSISKLLRAKQKDFVKSGRDTKINFADPRMKSKLSRQGYKFTSVLPKGAKIFLLDNANLSTGGDAVDVTNKIHKDFKKISTDLTKKMGLRMAGVDLMIQKGDITGRPKNSKYYVIEINAAPGLDHYVTTGPTQRKIVENMYLEVLKALGKKS